MTPSTDIPPGRHEQRRVAFRNTGGYDVRLTRGGVSEVGAALAQALRGRRALVVTTPTACRHVTEAVVAQCEAECGYALPLQVLACSERQKDQRAVEAILSAAHEAGFDRGSVLVAVGGGVCTDLVTMAAASIRRGIAQIRIPTTLIGQVDAAIGIKGSLNYRGSKSYLGCFFPPEAVLVEPAFLACLPERHIRAGLAEIAKMAIVVDRQLFELLEREPACTAARLASGQGRGRDIIWRSIDGMLGELEPNLFEEPTEERRVDFGHTFSPLVESDTGFDVLHGEAVAIDMALSTELAAGLGILAADRRDRIMRLLGRLEVPLSHPSLTAERCLAAIRDACGRRGGRLNLIVPRDIGQGACVAAASDITEALLRTALARLPRPGPE